MEDSPRRRTAPDYERGVTQQAACYCCSRSAGDDDGGAQEEETRKCRVTELAQLFPPVA